MLTNDPTERCAQAEQAVDTMIRTEKLLRNEIAKLRKENARLRAGMEKMAKDPPATLDEPDPDWKVIQKMREIVRKALAVPNGMHDTPRGE